MAIVTLNGGSIRADDDFLECLVALKLDTVPGVFGYEGPGFQRTHANRDNLHIVEGVPGRQCDLFLKRHRGFEVKEALKLLMARAPLATAGRREWENIFRMEAIGIPTMRPVAFGEKKRWGLEKRSFLITERIPGGVPMDDYVREHYSGVLEAARLREKRSLLWDAGSLARRLHGAGYTHMDLYLNHIFVRETPSGDKALHLIDLQRVARRWAFRRRWIVKDLAALLYSMRDLPLTRTDGARVLAAYFDGSLRHANRRLLSAALQRCRRMAARR